MCTGDKGPVEVGGGEAADARGDAAGDGDPAGDRSAGESGPGEVGDGEEGDALGDAVDSACGPSSRGRDRAGVAFSGEAAGPACPMQGRRSAAAGA